MQHVFAPWRYQYVTSCDDKTRCVFCEIMASSQDEANLVVFRGKHNFVVLNRYPYSTGHAMVVPYRHLGFPADAEAEEMREMMDLSIALVKAMKGIYQSHGYNLGMNIGRAAGAGIDEHLHMHVLPRWNGDTNFITVVGDTRVLPEDLHETYRKLKGFFDDFQS